MGEIYVGDTGKTLRVNANFDMSSYTELSLIFSHPKGTNITKTTANGVVLGTTSVSDPDIGTLDANEYVTYELEAGFIDQAGPWRVYIKYENTNTTPDDIFHGKSKTFQVRPVE